MITFVGGSKFAKGGPNPPANMDSRGSISASGFGPGSPYPLADLDRGVQIQGGPNPGGPNPGGSKSTRTPVGIKYMKSSSYESIKIDIFEFGSTLPFYPTGPVEKNGKSSTVIQRSNFSCAEPNA